MYLYELKQICMLSKSEQKVLELISIEGESSSKEIFDTAQFDVSYATLKRTLAKLVSDNYLVTHGRGRATKYSLSPTYTLLKPIDIDIYFSREIDERKIKESFNFEIFTELLNHTGIFTDAETNKLKDLQSKYLSNIAELSEAAYHKELERLAIDLSWKSSQIEGNTYSLLETERLLKEKVTADGKTKEEATMLLNHKDALDFILENKDYLNTLSTSKIENIHSILIKELGVKRNLRKRRVGISGTNFQPIDNQFQIIEALTNTCDLINKKPNVFEKALLALFLISYIHPFMDGNKRTARIVSNAILINYGYCPISFRTVSSIDYKKAMLLFYEQNNISNFKEIFIEQFEFAVEKYF